MLLKNKTASIELTQEAFSVLSVPDKRKYYDQFLKLNKHVSATTLKSIDRNRKKTKYESSDSKVNTKGVNYSATHPPHPKKSSRYKPLIAYYCIFCKTPQSHCPIKYIDELCVECSSPLYSSQEKFSLSHRFFSRIDLTSSLRFYTYWPSIGAVATLSDLSPTGLCFTAKEALNIHEIIKLEAEQFKAVGQVKYIKCTGSLYIIGAKFLTIQFNTQKGNFMSTSA